MQQQRRRPCGSAASRPHHSPSPQQTGLRMWAMRLSWRSLPRGQKARAGLQSLGRKAARAPAAPPAIPPASIGTWAGLRRAACRPGPSTASPHGCGKGMTMRRSFRLSPRRGVVLSVDFADDVAGAKKGLDLHTEVKKKIHKIPVESIDSMGQRLLQRLPLLLIIDII